MNAISNKYDCPRPPVKPFQAKQFDLDFAYSESAEELDKGVRETIQGMKMSILATGVALYRIQAAEYFADLGYKRFGLYVDKLANDMSMTRANIYNWVYIGEAYIKNRTELEKVGFNNEDGPTKLPFLGMALENHPKKEVFRNIKDMPKREFEEWARGLSEKTAKRYKNVRVQGNQVFLGNKPLAVFSDGMAPDDRHYYERLLLEAAEAKADNEVIGVYRFYDEQERKVFDRVYSREIKILRRIE